MDDRRCSSLVHVASGATIFTLLLRRRVAFLHRTATLSATLQSMSIIVVNLLNNRAVFRIFITLLKFSFNSPSQFVTRNNWYAHGCKDGAAVTRRWRP